MVLGHRPDHRGVDVPTLDLGVGKRLGERLEGQLLHRRVAAPAELAVTDSDDSDS